MIDESFLHTLGIIVIAAAAFASLLSATRLPSIVAYLAAGLVLGPLTGMIEISHAIDLIAEAGIVLLLFLVGLELTLEKIGKVGKVALVAGGVQIVLSVAGGWAIAAVQGFEAIPALFLGLAMSLSSTVVVVKMLLEKEESGTSYGQIAIGVLLVQDVFVVILLTSLSGLSGAESLDVWSVALGLGKAFAGMVLLLGTVTLVARYLLKKPFAWAARSPETLVIWSLSWCFLVVALTQVLHLSAEIGAFAAGVSLAQLPYSHDLQRRVRPLMNFFVAVAFVIIGLGINLNVPAAAWVTAGTLSLFVFFGKFAILFLVIQRLGYAAKTAFFAALLLIQISEFSFIFMAQGVELGFIDAATENVAGLVGLITISLSTVMIGFKETLFRFAMRLGFRRIVGKGTGEEESEGEASEYEGDVIIVGMNSLGREMVRLLQERGVPVVAIDRDPSKLARVSCRTVLGDGKSRATLQEAGLEHSRLLVSTLHIESANDLIAYEAHRAGVRSAIHAVDLKATDHLLEMDVSYFIVPKADGLKRQNTELERLGFLSPSEP